MPPGRAEPGAGPIAVERAQRALKTVEHAFPVRVPPRRRQPAAVHVGELDLRELVEPVSRVRAAVPGALTASPRSLTRSVRVHRVVHPDRAGLEPRGHGARSLAAPRPDARAEPERRVVGKPDAVLLVVYTGNRDDRPEDLLAVDPPGVGTGICCQHRRLVEPAGQADVRARAPRDHPPPPINTNTHNLPH